MTHSSEVRRAAFVLLGGGCSARQVGALLGVSRSQVSQWRVDAGGVIKNELRGGARYLSREDRYEIARLREHGLGVRAIAKRLGRTASTVSRELRRNDASRDGRRNRLVRGYQPELAHQLMMARRPRPNGRSWPDARPCGPGCSTGWTSMTHPNRSLAGCAWSSVTMSRCTSATRRFTGPSICAPGAS